MADPETILQSRFQEKFTAAVPDVPAGDVFQTLIDMLMSFLTDSLGNNPPATGEEAIARVKTMSPFRQSFLRARAQRAVRLKHGKKAGAAVNPVITDIIRESTGEEQVAFASHVLQITDDDFASA